MRVHIIGLAGSGKTTLARRLGAEFDAPIHDLDFVAYDAGGKERSEDGTAALVERIVRSDRWVAEGAYHAAWLRPVLDAADAIVWLDVPFRTCAWRMVKRHVRAELSGHNLHPGWRKLWRFISYTRRTAARQSRETSVLLAPYRTKTLRCRSRRELDAVRVELRAKRDQASAA